MRRFLSFVTVSLVLLMTTTNAQFPNVWAIAVVLPPDVSPEEVQTLVNGVSAAMDGEECAVDPSLEDPREADCELWLPKSDMPGVQLLPMIYRNNISQAASDSIRRAWPENGTSATKTVEELKQLARMAAKGRGANKVMLVTAGESHVFDGTLSGDDFEDVP